MIAKTFSRKLRGKFASRFLAGHTLRADVRLSSFFVHKSTALAVAKTLTPAITPTAELLEDTSYLRDRETLWQLRTESRLMKRKYRSDKFSGGVVRGQTFKKRLIQFREQTADSIPERLLSTLNTFPVTTPL